jgi:protease II
MATRTPPVAQVLLRASDFGSSVSFRRPVMSADESRIAVLCGDGESGQQSLLVASISADGRDVRHDDYRTVPLPCEPESLVSAVEWFDNDTLIVAHSSSAEPLFATTVTAVSLDNGATLPLFAETASDRAVDVFRTQDDRHIVIRSESHLNTEFRSLSLAARLGADPLVVFPREFDSIAHLRHEHGRFWILHDVGRLRNRHVRIDAIADDALDWSARTPVLHDLPGHTVGNLSVHAQHLLLFTRSERSGLAGLMALKNFVDLQPIDGISPLALDVFSNYPHPTRAPTVPIHVRDPCTTRTHSLELSSLTLSPVAADNSWWSRTLEQMVIEHHLVPSRSASLEPIEVPMITLRGKNTPLDGTATCVQYVYGAYGDSWPFALEEVELQQIIEAGVVVALCAVRGGGEKGDQWHAAGRGDNKYNSFRDTVACGDFLLANGYAAHDALCVFGHSAGAFTAMGAVDARPTMYAVVICTRPFVDAAADDSSLRSLDEHLWGSFSPTASLPALLEQHGSRFPSMFFYGSLTDPNAPFEPAMTLALRLTAIAASLHDNFDQSPLIFVPVRDLVQSAHMPPLPDLKARIFAFCSSEVQRRRNGRR